MPLKKETNAPATEAGATQAETVSPQNTDPERKGRSIEQQKAVGTAAEAAVATRDTVVVPDEAPDVELGAMGKFRAVKSRIRDPHAGVMFYTDRDCPAEVTDWVRSQLRAGILIPV